jgi:oxygen-independent coproporphyrinogen-3 oxidase
MSELLGVAFAHDERVTAANEQYSVFFEMLRTFDWRTEPIEEPFSREIVKRYRNILVGEPHRGFSPAEVASIREWVASGGNLLMMAGVGGDNAPGGDISARSNLGELTCGIRFNDDCLGIDRGVARGAPFDTKLVIEIGHLVGVPAKLCYDTGCSLSLDSDFNIRGTELLTPANSARVTGVRLSGQHVQAQNPYPSDASGLPVVIHIALGKGRITALGSSYSFLDDTIIREDNTLFLNWIIMKTFGNLVADYIHRYSALPQRHRMLHGFPFPNLMGSIPSDTHLKQVLDRIPVSATNPIIIGVLPHTSCNPRVQGCGFCTFPHELFNLERVRASVSSVIAEIDHFNRNGLINGSSVKAIYFGGGTANLTPTDQFRELCQKLIATFRCPNAEVTLEGVPAYFETENFRYFDVLTEQFGSGAPRISMGVQTFDEALLRRMGRTHFGDRQCIRRVVHKALGKGFQVSGDLLFNLPDQSLENMKADVAELADMGFSQISLYHLVMFRTLGPEWSRDGGLLAALPNNLTAMHNWLALRDELLSRGYKQTTLTNFEKTSESQFKYEDCVFCPEKHNWLGFGPAAISLFADDVFDRGVKLINPETATAYRARQGMTRWDRYFTYGLLDMKVLYITRKIALLGLDKGAYQRLFFSSIDNDFAEETYHLARAGLISDSGGSFDLTSKGCFYADTIAGVFALRTTRLHRMLAFTHGRTPMAEDFLTAETELQGKRQRMG